jgi:hypothetical protein
MLGSTRVFVKPFKDDGYAILIRNQDRRVDPKGGPTLLLATALSCEALVVQVAENSTYERPSVLLKAYLQRKT